MAQDVRFEFGAWESLSDDDVITDDLHTYLRSTHRFAPGQRQRILWRHDPQDGVQPAGSSGAPMALDLTVTYADDQGLSYRDSFTFDLDVLSAVTPLPGKGSWKIGQGKELANIDDAIRNLGVAVTELRR